MEKFETYFNYTMLISTSVALWFGVVGMSFPKG